ncbi:malonate decarboxylase acyl carrier protein [Bordetella genomosp. 9]|uniref:Malonate decarboxylase acyl carrier protein n=1 Tax=Bordetella genomosp. 9 TaxID=1416803 RepID=A0A261R1K8_9BORD|nr:malonate decarboxylase subunit delta [Bordetella genomosp. 9]OZI18889.1 malonate decarboxylase acyl carrier protein [Bordetella genomosp. 9]
MERLNLEFSAGAPAASRVLAGIVSSGDLEILLEPNTAGKTEIAITTSVNGMSKIWSAVLARMFDGTSLPASRIEIRDFGATPGVVRMRLEQVFEQLNTRTGSQG